MSLPARQRALDGRYSRVDGIDFELPVNSLDSPALMAGFTVDAGRAAALLPGEELRLIRLPGGKALLLVTVIHYRTTDIGAYVEYSIALGCVHRRAGSSALRSVLADRTAFAGQYVWDLPVSTLVSVKGGKGIWGMPKHRANLDFRTDARSMSSQYDLDGELCMRVTVRRPRGPRIPLRNVGAANYCQFRGMLMRSSIYFSDRAEVALGPFAKGELRIGDHPRMAPLRALAPSRTPFFVACLPHSHGVLDDHVESWFLTSKEKADVDPEGLESVTGLPNDEQWLPAPDADGR